MQVESDILERVVAELNERTGDLPRVARESGVPYDTVLRIKNRENDPGYSKVRTLHRYLFGSRDTQPAALDEPEPEAA